MCKLRRITHKFNIKPGEGFMLNLWVIRRNLHIDKNQKIKFPHKFNIKFVTKKLNFIPYNSNFGTKQHNCKRLLTKFQI